MKPLLSLLRKPAPEHSQLDATKAAAADARQVIADRRETLARLQTVDDHANQLARAAADAMREANEARARWVDNGCLQHAREHHAATEEATKAANEAQLAALDAKTARAAMPAAEAAVRRAEEDLKNCNQQIDDAVWEMLFAKFAPTIERFRSVTRERHDLHIELRGFLEAASGEASRQVSSVLAECRVESIPDYACSPQGSHVSSPPDSVLERARQWLEDAAALRGEPNS